MVDRLGALTRAIATLRRNLDKPAADAVRAPGAAPLRGPSAPPHAAETRRSHVASLGVRLAALRRDDPQRERKALRLFVEAVLLDEFGDELILSADFQAMVDRSLSVIESDDSLRSTLADATRELLPDA